MTMPGAVHDDPSRHRFELDLDGQTAFANYRRAGDVLTISHTEVPPALNGRGYGSALVKGVLDIARAQGLKVVPACPFVRSYVERHSEYADLLR
jgi:predicted GNAT family acetyltransferase